MIAFFFLIIAFICGLWGFIQKKKEVTIISYFFILTNGFQFLDLSSVSIKALDFTLILSLFIIIYCLIHKIPIFKIKGDNFATFILTLIFFFVLEFIITILTGNETPLYTFKTVRPYLFFINYFIIKQIKKEDILKAIRLLFYITIIQGVFYYLQLIGLQGILKGSIEEAQYPDQLNRMRNVPSMTPFYLFYVIYIIKNTKLKPLFILFFLGLLIIPMSRGPIIQFIAVNIIYLLITRKFLKIIYIFSFAIVAALLFWPFLQYRFVKEENTSQDIRTVLNLKKSDSFNASEDGTFSFRIAILLERYEYLLNNPKYLLLGVGCIHEESPKCYERFNFDLGTMTENLYFGKSMLGSVDNTWVEPLIKYGIVGVGAIISLFLYPIFKVRKLIFNPWYGIIFMYLLFYFLGSFNEAAILYNGTVRMLFLISFALIDKGLEKLKINGRSIDF